MVRVRIISFAHPKNWNDTAQKTVKDDFVKITSTSKSWVKRNGSRGVRYGIYKTPELVNPSNLISLPLVWEKIMASSSSKIEDLLDSVETGNENSISTFTGKLVIDFEEGLGYLIETGFILMPIPKITELLEKLSEDTGVSLNNARFFSWDKNKIIQFRDVAVQNNFTPTRETGSIGLVRIDARGDIEHEPKWINAESMLNDGSWTKSSYENLDQNNRFGFALVKKGNYVSFHKNVENDNLSLLMSRIFLVKGLFEQTLGKTIPEYCFSDHL
ncbi:MAG: hypothetical protein LDL06_02895 [Candidatus Nitrosotenuis sp.]|nr:hypothetical protein [Candidatus Nitrosotenuis sp.]